MPSPKTLTRSAIGLGVITLGWLILDDGGRPPAAVWVWSHDGGHPMSANHVRQAYDLPGGTQFRAYVVRPDLPATPQERIGLSLRKKPRVRDKVLTAVGFEPGSVRRWVPYRSTGRSVESAQGTFWEFEH